MKAFFAVLMLLSFTSKVHGQTILSCEGGSNKTKLININTVSKAVLYSKSNNDYVISKGVIYKHNKVILITIGGKRKMFFRDKNFGSDDPKQHVYEYIGVINKAKIHVIKDIGYETEQYILVNSESGSCIRVWGIPHMSPNGSKLFTCAANIDYDSMPNGIQLISIQKNMFNCIAEYNVENWEPGVVVWKGDNMIYFEKKTPAILSPTKKNITAYGAISLQ